MLQLDLVSPYTRIYSTKILKELFSIWENTLNLPSFEQWYIQNVANDWPWKCLDGFVFF